MTREEKQKAIDVLKISAPVMTVTQEEFKDYIQTLNKIMDWLEQEPCEDAISRILKRMWNCRGKHTISIDKVKMEQIIRDELPSVKTQEPFINKPCIAHQICHEDKVKILDKIRAEIEKIAKPNELGGRGNGKSIRYGLCMALDIIDKYKAESEDKE